MKKKSILILIILFAILILFFISKYNSKSNTPNEIKVDNNNANTILKGVTLSPISYEKEDFNIFLEKLPIVANTISYQGSIENLENDNNPALVTDSLAKSKNLNSIVIVSFFNQSTGKLNDELDSQTKSRYFNLMSDYIKKNNPKYFGLGIEVNLLKSKNKTSFDNVVEFIDSSLKNLNDLYPETTYFTVFQLEQLKGYRGGIFGGINNTKLNDYELLNKFKNSEIIGLTTYPSLIFKNPTHIPSNYYKEINSYTNKKVLYTEIGWSSENFTKEWPNSEISQSIFIRTFNKLIDKSNTLGYIWAFLYDQDTKSPFNSMGLIERNGKAKKGYNDWINIK